VRFLAAFVHAREIKKLILASVAYNFITVAQETNFIDVYFVDNITVD
jgi:hypothetical protein